MGRAGAVAPVVAGQSFAAAGMAAFIAGALQGRLEVLLYDASLDAIGAIACFSLDGNAAATDAVAFVLLVVALAMFLAKTLEGVEVAAADGAFALAWCSRLRRVPA